MIPELKQFLHEYRNAVHALQLSIDLLRLGQMEDGEALEWLEIVEREADAVIRTLDRYMLDGDAPQPAPEAALAQHPRLRAPKN